MNVRSIRRSVCLILATVFICAVAAGCNDEALEQDNSSYISSQTVISVAESSPVVSEISEESEISEDIDLFALATEYILANSDKLGEAFKDRVDIEYINKTVEIFGSEKIEELADVLKNETALKDPIREVFGYSEKAFRAVVENDLERTAVLDNTDDRTTEFVFVGDCSFSNGYSVMYSYRNRKKGVEGIVSDEVLDIMRSADVTMANNEFTLTNRGAPIPEKKFTFRGDPKNVSIYDEMGVDIVGLANNHAFDYGPDSLTDTIATLDAAGIARVGAGANISEAKEPFYYIVNGYKFAIIAGSMIDFESTRGATEKLSGVFRFANASPMKKEIEKAKENSDFVIVYMHWGRENTTDLTAQQKSCGRAFIDAGADIVVGMHSHCMQGLEYYKDKLIVYSLGNFTFSSRPLTCAMVKMSVSPEGEITNMFYPMMQQNNFTYINSGESGEKQLELLKKLLINAEIADDFTVTSK